MIQSHFASLIGEIKALVGRITGVLKTNTLTNRRQIYTMRATKKGVGQFLHYHAQGGTMMITNDQIEAYLIETGVPFEEVKEGFWLIHNEDDDVDNIVVVHTAPVITFRVKLMDAPTENRVELFEHLLKLNASSMIAGAYGLEEKAVVIVDSLQSENLDYNEFQASVDAIAFAVREHYEELRAFAPTKKKEN